MFQIYVYTVLDSYDRARYHGRLGDFDEGLSADVRSNRTERQQHQPRIVCHCGTFATVVLLMSADCLFGRNNALLR